MKKLCWFVVGAVAVTGCAGKMPEPRTPTMVRSFRGTIVPGYYVSPVSYEHYIRAQLLSNDGRAEEASDELRQAIASDGASPYLRTRLAEELLTLGRVDEARDEIEAALHLDTQFAEAHVDLARVKLRLGDGAGAELSLKRAIDVDRTCEDAYVLLVNLYHDRGQEGRVLDTWRELARNVPTSAPAHQALAQSAMARSDWKTAEAELLRALDLDGNIGDAREQLAELYQCQGRFAEAVATLQESYDRGGDGRTVERLVKLEASLGMLEDARSTVEKLEDEGGGVDRKLWIGWRWLDAQRPERAQKLAEAVLKVSDTAGAHLLLGRAFEELGQTDEAMEQLTKVPSRAAQFVSAQSLMGRLLRDRGRYHEAVDVLGKAIKSVAGGPDGDGSGAADSLQNLLAEVHERAGERGRSIQLLESALAQRPQSQELALALGAAYERAGQWEHGVDVVRSLLKRDPDSVSALNFIGSALARQSSRLDEARKLLEHALVLRPMSGEVADSLGWLYVKLGRLDDGERMLVRADRLSPEHPEVLTHLGELYVHKSDRARAVEAYKRALSHKPDEAMRHAIEEQLLLLESGKLAAGPTSR